MCRGLRYGLVWYGKRCCKSLDSKLEDDPVDGKEVTLKFEMVLVESELSRPGILRSAGTQIRSWMPMDVHEKDD